MEDLARVSMIVRRNGDANSIRLSGNSHSSVAAATEFTSLPTRKDVHSAAMGKPAKMVRRRVAVVLLGCAMLAAPARAGMPSLTLTDVARMRVEVISFFLLVFLLAAWAVMGLWNGLRRDFPRFPRMTYKRAVAVTGLWGLLFVLVLTMISGARELMTPGAWEKRGATYQLADKAPAAEELARRTVRLAELKAALWESAGRHGGAFPATDHEPGVPAAAWETVDVSRARYVYAPTTRPAAVLAYEPDLFDGPRLVLRADGRIVTMTPSELREALAGGGR
jgi:hypothetical protein